MRKEQKVQEGSKSLAVDRLLGGVALEPLPPSSLNRILEKEYSDLFQNPFAELAPHFPSSKYVPIPYYGPPAPITVYPKSMIADCSSPWTCCYKCKIKCDPQKLPSKASLTSWAFCVKGCDICTAMKFFKKNPLATKFKIEGWSKISRFKPKASSPKKKAKVSSPSLKYPSKAIKALPLFKKKEPRGLHEWAARMGLYDNQDIEDLEEKYCSLKKCSCGVCDDCQIYNKYLVPAKNPIILIPKNRIASPGIPYCVLRKTIAEFYVDELRYMLKKYKTTSTERLDKYWKRRFIEHGLVIVRFGLAACLGESRYIFRVENEYLSKDKRIVLRERKIRLRSLLNQTLKYKFCKESKREDIYQLEVPEGIWVEILHLVERLFRSGIWQGEASVGGESWGKIAEYVSKVYKAIVTGTIKEIIYWIDRTVNLEHNNGKAFNKFDCWLDSWEIGTVLRWHSNGEVGNLRRYANKVSKCQLLGCSSDYSYKIFMERRNYGQEKKEAFKETELIKERRNEIISDSKLNIQIGQM